MHKIDRQKYWQNVIKEIRTVDSTRVVTNGIILDRFGGIDKNNLLQSEENWNNKYNFLDGIMSDADIPISIVVTVNAKHPTLDIHRYGYLFDNGFFVQRMYVDYFRYAYPSCTYKTKKDTMIVVVYFNGEPVGAVSPMLLNVGDIYYVKSFCEVKDVH
jgi:hypothetical protein